ncbi:Phospholipase D-like protein [Beijerinckiaceae bacterium RH AL1]|nr:phospholipase D-like domain-containing protein [Beijerinckiaceae bacterium]VVB48653.1 Phospholipase D-like protein [Beijerinckiaceae bacterium RH CH11]VVB48734.1 Phospholipase D-like protein [Beijerinckiaceae bacterium RH AL8]VVC56502.1 Phospholipase D-like protein [Beijerinckiaceae bacterium RH AL1]
MRKKLEKAGLRVLAVAGTHVVLLGWDVVEASLLENLMGFAIQRTDSTENETIWLRGMKTFPNTPLPLGGTASSHEQPFQSFQWADYAAKPNHTYVYAITPMYGRPGALTDGTSVSVEIATEPEWGLPHSVFFNRGAIASQEYSRKFQGRIPSKVGQAAYDWLSRGLIEAIVAFIAKAKGQGDALRIAIYEFQWPAILQAVRDAAGRGVDVKVLYDAIDSASGPIHKNDEAIDALGIRDLCQGITNGKIMHNKFIVRLEGGAPVELLTGSTNYTENGIFGHLNCAHVVKGGAVAKAYLDYWTQISADPDLAALRDYDDDKTPAPPSPPDTGITQVFSPQHGTDTLARYAEIAGTATRGLFMTFAFGINADFLPVYQREDGILRFALMDTVGVGRNLAKAKQDIADIRAIKSTVVAIGQNITLNAFDRWLKEASGVAPGEHVRWVHTKFMLVDPLSDNPIVITGSANFSDASVSTNHENMLVVRGDTRIADIYLGEFMRQFSSYAFRDAAAAAAHGVNADDFRPQDLIPDASWIARYMQPGSSGALRRALFSGT